MTTVAEREVIQEQFAARMDEDELLNCMRCGFCLPTCPTYIQSGYKESHSPRGRIALMKAVVDGRIEPDADFEETINLCLGCRACEPVCPSGVNFGALLEDSRDIINQNKKFSFPVRVLRKVIFEELFPRQDRMRTFTGLLHFYQATGLYKIARGTGIMKLFPETLGNIEKVLPKVATLKQLKNRPSFLEAEGVRMKRVSFFAGCLMDTIFMETNDSTLKLLQMAGCEIVIPKDQACCGALHGHLGEKQGAIDIAKKNIAAFENLDVDYIITNAGGCGAMLVDYGHLFHKDPEWAERANAFVSKLKDVAQILVEMDFHKNVPLYVKGKIITYQDSCHLRNVMKASTFPRVLLKAIEGSEYKEMKDADRCCGSAGVYNIVYSEVSMEMLDYKMEQTKQTHADIVVTSNPGCLLQMQVGIEREGMSDKTKGVHIADFLLEAALNGKKQLQHA